MVLSPASPLPPAVDSYLVCSTVPTILPFLESHVLEKCKDDEVSDYVCADRFQTTGAGRGKNAQNGENPHGGVCVGGVMGAHVCVYLSWGRRGCGYEKSSSLAGLSCHFHLGPGIEEGSHHTTMSGEGDFEQRSRDADATIAKLQAEAAGLREVLAEGGPPAVCAHTPGGAQSKSVLGGCISAYVRRLGGCWKWCLPGISRWGQADRERACRHSQPAVFD